MNSYRKSLQAVNAMRHSGAILARTLQRLGDAARPGVSGQDLDQIARASITAAGALPAFLGYEGYPACVCISTNDVVVHGIPTGAPLESGDLVSIDIGVTYQGWNADGAATFMVGEVDPEHRRLVQATREALQAGIKQVQDGVHLGTVQAAIQAVAEREHLGIVRTLTGHGIGQSLHEPPSIPNFGTQGTGPKLKEGMTICLEPMLTLGGAAVITDQDGWTIRTKDGSISAHEEHTILVTKQGAEILTKYQRATPVDIKE